MRALSQHVLGAGFVVALCAAMIVAWPRIGWLISGTPFEDLALVGAGILVFLWLTFVEYLGGRLVKARH